MDAFSPSVLHDYYEELVAACGGNTAAGPRPEELDNTKHVGGCSLQATPPILGVLFILWVLRRMLCREKLRQTYSGSEDAPELEEIVSTTGRTTRRVEGYSTRQGRLVSNNAAGRTAAPRAKKKGARAHELEPVLSG
jgi:hypothetical protein